MAEEKKDTISTESLMTEERTFPPSAEVVARAHTNAADYERMYARSVNNSDEFWLVSDELRHQFKLLLEPAKRAADPRKEHDEVEAFFTIKYSFSRNHSAIVSAGKDEVRLDRTQVEQVCQILSANLIEAQSVCRVHGRRAPSGPCHPGRSVIAPPCAARELMHPAGGGPTRIPGTRSSPTLLL